MNRFRILSAIAALCALLVLAVIYGSPYAPAVGPVLDIEDVWAIEDAREESDAPLVTVLENNGMRLGYDAQENTFYCPVGLDNGEEWPELRLSAPGAKGVQLAFADDYTYDWCGDAVREGVVYQILTYTQTAFAYAQIVFTGLPIVTLSTDGELDYEDMDAQVTLAAPSGGLTAKAAAHLRGAGSRFSEKKSYRINFVHGQKNSRAVAEVPGIGRADDIILLAGVMDDTLMRAQLGRVRDDRGRERAVRPEKNAVRRAVCERPVCRLLRHDGAGGRRRGAFKARSRRAVHGQRVPHGADRVRRGAAVCGEPHARGLDLRAVPRACCRTRV